jgi:hypothetical protein
MEQVLQHPFELLHDLRRRRGRGTGRIFERPRILLRTSSPPRNTALQRPDTDGACRAGTGRKFPGHGARRAPRNPEGPRAARGLSSPQQSYFRPIVINSSSGLRPPGPGCGQDCPRATGAKDGRRPGEEALRFMVRRRVLSGNPSSQSSPHACVAGRGGSQEDLRQTPYVLIFGRVDSRQIVTGGGGPSGFRWPTIQVTLHSEEVP